MTEHTYLVTGASRGIGEGIARLLLADGHSLIGTFRAASVEASRLESEYPKLVMRQVDFADRTATNDFIKSFDDSPPLNGIVNNAGIVEFETWDDFSIESWDRSFDVNVRTPVLLAHRLGSRMLPGAAIVNVASTDGFTGSFGSIAYSASKAALINATKSLGNVLGLRGVRVNSVAPGWIDTGMSTEASYEAAGLTPLGRNGVPNDVAAVVRFLLSPAAAYVNGATLVVDGGYTNVDSIMKKENDDLAGSD